jgi:hypothetical protein
MKLRPSSRNKEHFIVNINKKYVDLVEESDFELKYGKKINNQYQFARQDIKLEKQQDIFSMRGYCAHLDAFELEYWYPIPIPEDFNLDNWNVETEEEIIENEFLYLEKKIACNDMIEEELSKLETI